MNAVGGNDGNDLDSTVFLKALKNGVLITPAERMANPQNQMPFTQNDTLTLCMYGGGKPCKYCVSMYLDHQLVRGAFDGCDYIDVTPSAETMCKKTVDLTALGIADDACHHFYFIAIPFYTDHNYSERYALKSKSAALIGCTS